MNKFVRTKIHTGSNFFQNIYGAIMHVRYSSCAPILRFIYVASDGATANRQIPDRIIGQFFTSLRKASVASYASIWTLFSPIVRGLDVLYNALNVS